MKIHVCLNDGPRVSGDISVYPTAMSSDEIDLEVDDAKQFIERLADVVSSSEGYLAFNREVPGDLLNPTRQVRTFIPSRLIKYVDVEGAPDDE